ncbi:divergent PAP2 family protein [Candidatus Margulisiibacteriota bacterium]
MREVGEFIIGIFTNLPLVSAVIAMFVAQLIKVPYYYIKDKDWDPGRFFETGGMPSSHSAMVCSLSMTIGLTSGWNSIWFAIAVVFSIIVMYDAAGVRRAAGKQALILNRIVEDIYATGKVSENRLQELMGHTPLEVVFGALLGVLNSVIIYFIIF